MSAVPDVPGAHGIATHRTGQPEPDPFGEEIFAPGSRTIPPELHGSWLWEGAVGLPAGDRRRLERYVIAADHVVCGSAREPVIAVRDLDGMGVAVVTQRMDDDGWVYCLRYFGVSDDGRVLTDLESADMRYLRD